MRRLAILAFALGASACSTTQILDVAMRGAPRPRPAEMHVGDRTVYAGDLHTHIKPPDAEWHVIRELPATLALAESEHLDFIVLTPHVGARFFADEGEREWVLTTQRELRQRLAELHPSMIVVPGMEYTDARYGHVGVAFADPADVLRDLSVEDARAHPERFFERWVAAGGLLTINHPVQRPLNVPFVELRFDLSWRGFTGVSVPPEIAWITEHAQSVETFNMMNTYLRDNFLVGDEERSLREAAHLVDREARAQHRRIAPVGGTDSHSAWLRGTTWVLAKEKTAASIREAIAEARTCVRGPAACTLEVRVPGGEWQHVGDALDASDAVEARASGGAVAFVVDGAFVASAKDGETAHLPLKKDRCSVVRAVVAESWSAPVYVGCDWARTIR